MAWMILILAMTLPVSYLLIEAHKAPLFDDEGHFVKEKTYD